MNKERQFMAQLLTALAHATNVDARQFYLAWQQQDAVEILRLMNDLLEEYQRTYG